MTTKKEADRAWRHALRPKIELIQRLALTDDGKALFDLLESAFENRSLKGEDPYQTYYNLGQRDVVQYLRELRDIKPGESDDR